MQQRCLAFIRSKRALLGAAALACYATAIVLEPGDARSQLDAARLARPAAPMPGVEAPLSAIAPRGDAFAPRAEIDDDAPARVPAPRSIAQLHSSALPPKGGEATRVAAIATGQVPTAIVESGGTARVVTVGDPLDGTTVRSIDANTVILADGRRWSLGASASAP